ncbi:hypothetical protein TRVA0_004S04632 [Trichomonascus vanleenenianus]|uniref:uncharacterized protein n=1 Tax=Trichomonascus vanleenenianus TaxID=2268995 RepID=UPI003EC9D6E8
MADATAADGWGQTQTSNKKVDAIVINYSSKYNPCFPSTTRSPARPHQQPSQRVDTSVVNGSSEYSTTTQTTTQSHVPSILDTSAVECSSEYSTYLCSMATLIRSSPQSHVPRRLLDKSESAVGLGVYAGHEDQMFHYESFPRRASIPGFSPQSSSRLDFSDSDANSPHFNFSPYPDTAPSPFTPYEADSHASFVTVHQQKTAYRSLTDQKSLNFQDQDTALHFQEDASLDYQSSLGGREDTSLIYQPRRDGQEDTSLDYHPSHGQKNRYSYPVVAPELPHCPLEVTHPINTGYLPCTLQRRLLGPIEQTLHGQDATALVPIYNALGSPAAQFPFINSLKSVASENQFLNDMTARAASQPPPATPPSLVQSDSTTSNVSRHERSPSLSVIENPPPQAPPPTALLPQPPDAFRPPVDLGTAAMAASLTRPDGRSELLTRPPQNPLPLPKNRRNLLSDEGIDLFETRNQYRRNPTEHTMIRPPLSTYHTRYSSLEAGTPLSTHYPSFPTLPFGSGAHIATEKLSAGDRTLGESLEVDNFGRPVCRRELARMMLVLFILFPPLWLLMGTGFLDESIGVIPTLEKRLALLLGLSFLIIAIVCMVVGLTLGL